MLIRRNKNINIKVVGKTYGDLVNRWGIILNLLMEKSQQITPGSQPPVVNRYL
jgi:hypothetical protein